MKTRQQPKKTPEYKQPRKKPDKPKSKQVGAKKSLEKPNAQPVKRKRKPHEPLLPNTDSKLLPPVEPIKTKKSPAKLGKKRLKIPPVTTVTSPLKKPKGSKKVNSKEKSIAPQTLMVSENIEERNAINIGLQKSRQKSMGLKSKTSRISSKSPRKSLNKQKNSKPSKQPITSQEKVNGDSTKGTSEAKTVSTDPILESSAKVIFPELIDEKTESPTPRVHPEMRLSDICFYITEDESILDQCQVKEDIGQEFEEQVLVTNLDIEIPRFVPIEKSSGIIRRSRRKQHLEPENLEDITTVAYEKRHRKHELAEKKMKNREQELLAHQEYKKRLMMEELRHLKINKRTRTNRMSHPPRQKSADPTPDSVPVSVDPTAAPNIVDTHILLATIKRHSITRRANEIPLVLPNPLFFQVDFDLPRAFDTLKRRKSSS